jgi:type IV pilus assembly protein PilA
VELIVVLVIMAILAAALVPSLIGYISKTKEQNVQSECQSAVVAAQTIASGCYAATDGKYTFTDSSGNSVEVDGSADIADAMASEDGIAAVANLAELPANGSITTLTVNAQGKVTDLKYERGGKYSEYKWDDDEGGTYENGTVSSGD